MNFLFKKICIYIIIKLSFAQGIKKLFLVIFLAFLDFVIPPVRPEPLELRELRKATSPGTELSWTFYVWRVFILFWPLIMVEEKPTFLDLTDFYFVT